jgi:DNA end-binding protein Ku
LATGSAGPYFSIKNQEISMASHALWKGAISFGLVHIPVALHSATASSGLDFDWLDKRSMDPVGYKRINKKTGKEIAKENIVKGIEYESGRYVVLSEEEITAAYPKTTQTIDIESFVPDTEVPFIYLERPYYIAPVDKSAKVYALLRDTLLETRQVGIARVVIQLAPLGAGLVLNLLRWGEDIRSWEGLNLPPVGAKAAGLSDRELSMARQLVRDMAGKWNPLQFSDTFKHDIMTLVERKVREGKLETVAQPGEATETAANTAGAEVLDLTELLQRSLRKGAAQTPATRADKPKVKTGAKSAKSKSAVKTAPPATARRRAA